MPFNLLSTKYFLYIHNYECNFLALTLGSHDSNVFEATGPKPTLIEQINAAAQLFESRHAALLIEIFNCWRDQAHPGISRNSHSLVRTRLCRAFGNVDYSNTESLESRRQNQKCADLVGGPA